MNEKESSEEWRKKIKEESPYLASPVGGWGLVWVAWWRWPPRCAVAEDSAGVWWSWSWFLVTLWTLSCPTRSLMTSLISSMTSWIVVPFHCGVLDNDRPEQCCCFVYWLTARVPWLGHATSASSFLHRTLRKVCTSQHRPRSIAGISLGAGQDLLWQILSGEASGSRVRSVIVLPRGLTRRAGMSCLASVRLIWWLSWSETNGIRKVNVRAVVALSFRCLSWRFRLASRRDFG